MCQKWSVMYMNTKLHQGITVSSAIPTSRCLGVLGELQEFFLEELEGAYASHTLRRREDVQSFRRYLSELCLLGE
jgi:hypothetical protein